jgi:16S rRNA (adenine1518-N6/adenine1519-N6)-dimethyltransferase
MTHAPLIALPTLREVIDAHGLRATKKLGQNFLTDLNLTRKIVQAAGNVSGCHIIEIGPGPGGLTRALLESDAASVTAIELDARCLPIMEQLQHAYPNKLHVIHGDALKQDITALTPAPRAILANLPYNVATPLLIHWLHTIHHDAATITSMTLMFQKEVAERITAAPNCKDYGRLSVITQWLCDTWQCFDIPPQAFLPPPKIISTVVHFRPLAQPRFPADRQVLEKVLATSFGQRRKMLRVSLKGLTPDAEGLLKAAEIDSQRRAETLSVEEFCRIAQIYAHKFNAL